jgi:hypothetical protein
LEPEQTEQLSGQTLVNPVYINHITVYVSRYTETDRTEMLSPNNGRLSGAKKMVFLSRHSGQIPAAHACDSSIAAMVEKYVTELVRDMTSLWDQRDTNYHNTFQAKILG